MKFVKKSLAEDKMQTYETLKDTSFEEANK